MAGKVFLGSVSKGHYTAPFANKGSQFSFRSFCSSVPKTEKVSQKILKDQLSSVSNNYMISKNVQINNSIAKKLEIATPEQIAADPNLLNELAKQYEATQTDSDFIDGTKFCMEIMKSRLLTK